MTTDHPSPEPGQRAGFFLACRGVEKPVVSRYQVYRHLIPLIPNRRDRDTNLIPPDTNTLQAAWLLGF